MLPQSKHRTLQFYCDSMELLHIRHVYFDQVQPRFWYVGTWDAVLSSGKVTWLDVITSYSLDQVSHVQLQDAEFLSRQLDELWDYSCKKQH